MQILYELDLNRQDVETALSRFQARNAGNRSTVEFACRLVRGVIEKMDEIDELIQKYAENWDIRRMNRVDRNIVRLAMYEMLHCRDIPPVVSINEAVDIAKEFGDSKSGSFVNGILDRARKDLDRPAREAVQNKKQPPGT